MQQIICGHLPSPFYFLITLNSVEAADKCHHIFQQTLHKQWEFYPAMQTLPPSAPCPVTATKECDPLVCGRSRRRTHQVGFNGRRQQFYSWRQLLQDRRRSPPFCSCQSGWMPEACRPASVVLTNESRDSTLAWRSPESGCSFQDCKMSCWPEGTEG